MRRSAVIIVSIVGFFVLTQSAHALVPTGSMAQRVQQRRSLRQARSVTAVINIEGSSKKLPGVTATDHLRGKTDALVTLIEYGDFQCPFCHQHAPVLFSLLKTYDGKVNLVYRHFPLPFHPNAEPAAEASECAAQVAGNDGFWKYHDALFLTGDLQSSHLITMAGELGLGITPFSRCITAKNGRAIVETQTAGGKSAGVVGTPTTFIVDNRTKKAEMLQGALPLTIFTQAIDRIISP